MMCQNIFFVNLFSISEFFSYLVPEFVINIFIKYLTAFL